MKRLVVGIGVLLTTTVVVLTQVSAPPTGTGLVMGVVVEALSDRPVGGAIVTDGSQRVRTDAQGRFVLTDLPKGTYTITATKPGHLDGAYGRRRPEGPAQTLPLADGERVGDVKIRIWLPASITGTVTDESGEPMVDLPVRILRRTFVAGRRALSQGVTVTTDDRGLYRVDALTPADYVVVVPSTQASAPESIINMYGQAQMDVNSDVWTEFSWLGSAGLQSIYRFGGFTIAGLSFQSSIARSRAAVGPTPSADGRIFVYPTQYYLAATSAAHAIAIRLRPGEERSGADLQMKLVPTARVSGTVMGPLGPASIGLSLVPSADELLTSTDLETATSVSDTGGRYTFLGVPAGQYLLRTLWGTQPVSVEASDVRDVAVTIRPWPRVTGRVEFDDAAKQPAPDVLRRIVAMFESADGRPFVPPTIARGVADATGKITSNQLPPGRYYLRVNAPPPGWTLKSAILNGQDISNMPLKLEQDVSGLVVTFTNHPNELSGIVQNTAGATDATTSVLIFPAEPGGWTDYGETPRRVRSIRTDKDGGYKTAGLPSGDYLVVAIADDAAANWQDPQILQALARVATRITLTDGERRSLSLRTAVIPR